MYTCFQIHCTLINHHVSNEAQDSFFICLCSVCLADAAPLLSQECVYESCENIETQVLSQNLVRLVWVDRPTTILLIKKPGDPEATKVLIID